MRHDWYQEHVFEGQISPLATAVVAVNYKGSLLPLQIRAIEEMSELTKEIAKDIRYLPRLERQYLAEEMGHVILTVIALMQASDIEIERVINAMRDAVKRMLKASNLTELEIKRLGMEGVIDGDNA